MFCAEAKRVIRQLNKAIRRRNGKISKLKKRVCKLEDLLLQYYLAVNMLTGGVPMRPYGGFTASMLVKMLERKEELEN